MSIELLKKLNYDVKQITANKINIYTDNNRIDELKKLAILLSAVYNPQPTSTSSVGYVQYLNYKIYVKPLNKQGNKSAGLGNESFIINKINNIIQDKKIDIIFSANKQFVCKNVYKCEAVGKDIKNRKKADIVLYGDKKYYISIKKDNAEIWESSDSYISEISKTIILKLINEKKIEIINKNNVNSIKPSVAFKANNEQTKNVIFGTDILNNGCIIKKTFSDSDFIVLDNNLSIHCSHIIEDETDIIQNENVWFLIRNDSTRKSPKLGYNGLRVLAVYESRVNKNVLKVLQ